MAPRRGRLSGPEIRDLPDWRAEARKRALEAVNLARTENISLTEAARRANTTLRTIHRYGARAIRKSETGRLIVKPFDRIIRRMRWLTPNGLITLPIRDSRSASKVGRYWAAVGHFLETGDAEPLQEFRGEVVQVQGIQYEFLLDLQAIEHLAKAGVPTFPDIYDLTA